MYSIFISLFYYFFFFISSYFLFFFLFFFFFNNTPTTEIYTLSLHDALPICSHSSQDRLVSHRHPGQRPVAARFPNGCDTRSEEHTSELQSHSDLVCRLLLEKKKKTKNKKIINT